MSTSRSDKLTIVLIIVGIGLILAIVVGILVAAVLLGPGRTQTDAAQVPTAVVSAEVAEQGEELVPTFTPRATSQVAVQMPTASVNEIVQPEATPTPEVEPTPELIATPTIPVPTVTPIPPTFTPAPVVGTYANPVPLGQSYRIPGWGALTVIESQWFPNQIGVAVVQISFTCERPPDQFCDTADFMLDSFGKTSGTGHEQEFSSSVPEPGFGSIFDQPEVYGGGIKTGYAGFLVDTAEELLVMRVGLYLEDLEAFFALR